MNTATRQNIVQFQPHVAMSLEQEKDLICRHQAGDTVAGDALISNYIAYGMKLAQRFARTSLDNDLAAETLEAMLEALNKYNLNCSVRFMSFARYYIRGRVFLECKARNRFSSSLSGDLHSVAAVTPDWEAVYDNPGAEEEHTFVCKTLNEALQKLPEELRDVVKHVTLQNQTFVDYAKELTRSGQPITAAGVRLRLLRATQLLRRSLRNSEIRELV